jgi:hypothetical protein
MLAEAEAVDILLITHRGLAVLEVVGLAFLETELLELAIRVVVAAAGVMVVVVVTVVQE